MLPHLYGRLRRPLPRSAIDRLPSGASPAEIAASKLRCARLAAPFVTALCSFDTLRGGSAARRSYVIVSSRAYSSPAPQPASRHSIKPFSIYRIMANIRRPAGFRSKDVGRRRDECSIRHVAVSTSQYNWRLATAVRRMAIRFFRRKTSHNLNSVLLRMFAMMV